MMLPIVIGDAFSIPDVITHYSDLLSNFACMAQSHIGKVGYLTVDEKIVQPNQTHRRAGMHVDGGEGRGWGGGGRPWASNATGMLTVSSHPGCRVWAQDFTGEVGDEGSCDHLRNELLSEGIVLGAGDVYWMDGMCVHESIPQPVTVRRQFIRLSLPSTAPWYEGYTENPLGVMPTGPILPRRKFMDDGVAA
jgi:hypothetical protein